MIMKKEVLFASLMLALFVSCAEKNYYQVYDITSNDVSLSEGILVYDNSDCRITYNMWSEGGNLSFLVQNKTDKNLYVVLPQSFFILNGVANDYYSEMTYTRAVTNSAELSASRQVSVSGFLTNGIYWYPSHIGRVYGASIGTSTTEGVQIKESPLTCVPPKSAKLVYGYNISDHIYKDCDNYKFNYPSRVSPSIGYQEGTTPVKFRNRIAYTFDEKTYSDIKYIDHSFWMSSLQNYSEKAALDKLKYEECETSSKKSLKSFTMSSPNRFYNIYNKNPRAKHSSKKSK